jgi:WD40 repeat protein
MIKLRKKLIWMGCAVALVAALAAMPASASASSTCAGRNGSIAAAGENGLALIGPGGGVRWLLGGPGKPDSYVWDLSFSCSGRAIAYVGDNETTCPPIEIVNVLTGKRRLFEHTHYRGSNFPTGGCAFAPSFLRDGRLLFDVVSRGKPGTYVASPDGRHRHRLFGDQVCASTADAHWFVSCTEHSLALLDQNGHRVRFLTPLPTRRKVHYFSPSFSPDGRWIAYARAIDTPAAGSYERSEVYIIRRSGTHRRRLTFGQHSYDPAFSPDGRWIVFTRGDEGSGDELAAVSFARPGQTKLLSDGHGWLRSLTWGPR